MRDLRASLLLSVALLLPATAAAQSVSKVYGDTTVEVIGLSRWTIDELQDAVREHKPGVTLAEHACAVVLRESVGFADAAAISMGRRSDSGAASWMILLVVEPGRQDLVRYRSTPEAEEAVRPAYEEVLTILREDRSAIGALQHGDVLLGDATSVFGQPVPASALALRHAIQARATHADHDHAVDSILRGGNRNNRVISMLVLTNFAQWDTTWHALAEAVRTGGPDYASSIASMLLKSMAETGDYRVDWGPAREALEAILGGTNLFAYVPMLQVLVQTRIDPELGRELVAVNPELLLDSAAAENPYTPEAAQAFLRHVTGADHGSDIDAWRSALSGPR